MGVVLVFFSRVSQLLNGQSHHYKKQNTPDEFL